MNAVPSSFVRARCDREGESIRDARREVGDVKEDKIISHLRPRLTTQVLKIKLKTMAEETNVVIPEVQRYCIKIESMVCLILRARALTRR